MAETSADDAGTPVGVNHVVLPFGTSSWLVVGSVVW